MSRLTKILEAVKAGDLVEARKHLFVEMEARKEKLLEQGREFVAGSIVAEHDSFHEPGDKVSDATDKKGKKSVMKDGKLTLEDKDKSHDGGADA